MTTGLSQACGHCWVFHICWHIECSTFTASTFRIWNSSNGIPSPPLTLLVVTFLKAHLTLHSKLSDCRWRLTPLQLSGSLRSFLYSSSMYSCHLFLISFASAAAAKSLQSCLTLCDPIDSSLAFLGFSRQASPYCFCPLFCPFLHKIFLWYLKFSWRDF